MKFKEFIVSLCQNYIMAQRGLTKDQKEELFEMYKTYKYTYKNLAEHFNTTVSAVSCMLTREGLKGKREHNHFRKYKVDQYFFDEINTEEKAYFLGFLCADGCNHSGNTKVSLSLKEEDLSMVTKLNNLIQPTKPLTYSKRKRGNQYILQISNRRISEKLNSLGCVPRKSLILDFPTEEQVPEEFMRHYLRGYFDGNGWLGKKDISITSSNLFSNKLLEYLKRKYDFKTSCRRKNKVTELVFSRYSIKPFLDLIYKNSNIFLNRKYNRYLKYHL